MQLANALNPDTAQLLDLVCVPQAAEKVCGQAKLLRIGT
jgi:hypothetical protein